MSILSGLVNKLKKEVIDKVADAITHEVLDNKPEEKPEEKPVGYVIPGGVPNGFVIGGGGSKPAAASEYEDDWYDTVPAEECQYNSGLHYLEYFSKLFREEFPEYVVSLETVEPERRYKYSFMQKARCALVVELMTEKSEANKLRRETLRAGIPYLRFYFDHSGWWNTRKYVVGRVKDALN